VSAWVPTQPTSRGAKVAEVNQTERNWNKDMPAYKRLRANGLQPKRIDGAADVEKKAQESWQVETGDTANYLNFVGVVLNVRNVLKSAGYLVEPK
jgi:hypothetical protein